MAKTKLEQFAEEQRKTLLLKNVYNGSSDNQMYSSTHTRAMSDEETPEYGKGTGQAFDTKEGGSATDIKARKENLRFNEYNRENTYQKPGMGEDED
jgi:hypothetical protein